MDENVGKGRPRKFKNEIEFEKKVRSYIEYCKKHERFPNIAGFCAYADINRDTFYANKEYYSDTYKKVEDIFEDNAINSHAINETLKIFYLKNKCGYSDKTEIKHSGNLNLEDVL